MNGLLRTDKCVCRYREEMPKEKINQLFKLGFWQKLHVVAESCSYISTYL